MYTVGIDLGTTGCKAVLVDRWGCIVGQEYLEYSLIVHSSDKIEQDSNDWWNLSCAAVKSAVANSGVDKSEVTGVSVTSQGISFVLTDALFNPIGNAISWLDSRAEREVEDIGKRFSNAEIFKITGLRNNSTYLLPKLLWLKKNDNDSFRLAKHVLMAHDFLIAKMTGRAVTDHTMAGGTMLYDVTERKWSETLARTFKIDSTILPEIISSGTIAGHLLASSAKAMGLNSGIAIAVGGQDQKVAALSVLSEENNLATLSLGTAGAMEFILNSPVFDQNMRIPLFPYLFDGMWTLEAVVSTTGACLKWLRNTLFPHLSYNEMDTMALSARAGGLFFYPHFSGASSPIWDSQAKGSFYGLSLDTEAADTIKSVLEGIAFQIRANLEICEALSEKKEALVLFGSGGTSPVWCQIISDITAKTVISLSTPDAAGIGAAKLAFMAVGESLDDFGKKVYQNSKVFHPREAFVRQYDEIYEAYKKIENRLV